MPRPIQISVVMTTFNRSDLLAQTLDSLAAAAPNQLSWQLIVVDNASTDRTADVLASYAESLPIVSLYEPVAGYARAKNRGLEQATGEIIVFTDDDVIVASNWLSALFDASQRWPDVNIFGGRIQPVLPDQLPPWLRSETMQTRMTRRFGYFYPRSDEGFVDQSPIGCNLALRASVVGDLRLDENRGADGSSNYLQSAETDFIGRLIARGERVLFVPDAYVDHIIRPGQLTLAAVNARAFRRGRKNALEQTERYNSGPRIAGAPLKLWARVVLLMIRSWIVKPFGERARYSLENKLSFRRGFLYQRRLESQQTRANDTPD
ncbi:glycosyltransferase family 2 protein [Salinisphaera sp.]|uniref:glycosyltransferase family 2 protein n=1 Tax=Salinisphaera sp. TaxID=1914330 RepID=UPI000C64A346|nr:glycosyltransferase family 2 protein [Salinisphaera sp.]MAS09667.1 hypothetical protein [Salinisphaera sp.]|tara:strand:- start:482 stop:1441 length:960 start_codon:yes stop_codon:yes gene_type:complete